MNVEHRTSKFDGSVKRPPSVIPAEAGIYNYLKLMDPRLRGDDKKCEISTYYGTIKFER
jgi:hypothetical protein